MENSRIKIKNNKQKTHVLNLAGVKETWYLEGLDQRTPFFLWDLSVFDKVSSVERMCMTKVGVGWPTQLHRTRLLDPWGGRHYGLLTLCLD